MKILYMPLDERPCNYKFPEMNIIKNNSIELIEIPLKYMGNKKNPANLEQIYNWLEENIYLCDAAVISLEMIIHGGLLPSRIHSTELATLKKRLEKFIKLIEKVKKYKEINIFLFALVMRTPSYSSSEEEPSYYQEYGEYIFKRGYLLDKQKRSILTKEEENILKQTTNLIPQEIINDYENRRVKNRDIIINCALLLKDKIIDYLVIPQDDSSKFGYGPQDKQVIFSYLKQNKIEDKVLTYPGADEVGSALLCRCILMNLEKKPSIAIMFDREKDQTLIPKYEGMALIDSIKHQINVSSAIYQPNISDADIILFIHTSNQKMCDSWLQQPYSYNDNVYKQLLKLNKPFIICDVAFANGSDLSFVKSVFNNLINDKMLSYAAWNTSGNTIGTAISSGLIQYLYGNKYTRDKLLFYRIADDCVYQSIIRRKYYKKLKYQKIQVTTGYIDNNDNIIKDKIKKELTENLKMYYNKLPFAIKSINFPWFRLFEIDIELGEID